MTPEDQIKKQVVDFELSQKRKAKEAFVRNALRQMYGNIILEVVRCPEFINKDPEEICRRAYNIAKWMQAIWFEENPEDSPENVEDVTLMPPGSYQRGY